MSLKVHVHKARKVLVASVGVATVSFVGLGCAVKHTSVANLPAPPSCDVAPNDPNCIGGPIDGGPDTPDAAGDDADATTG